MRSSSLIPPQAPIRRRFLSIVPASRKLALLAFYRREWSDVLRGGRWQTIDCSIQQAQFIFSSWNPGGRRLSPAANRRADAEVVRLLLRLGLAPMRTRSSSQPHEFGWMIPHQPIRSLAILRAFGQLAGVVLRVHAREVLWVDSSVSYLNE